MVTKVDAHQFKMLKILNGLGLIKLVSWGRYFDEDGKVWVTLDVRKF